MKFISSKNAFRVWIFLSLISCNSTSLLSSIKQVEKSYPEYKIPIWQKQLEYIKNKDKTNDGQIKKIYLVNYIHCGTINSEDEKEIVIEQLFSDTTSVVQYLDDKTFEIIPLKSATQKNGNWATAMKAQLKVLINVGMELIEAKWHYKDNTYYSLIIASNEQGVIYDNIGYFILESTQCAQQKEKDDCTQKFIDDINNGGIRLL